MQEASSLEEPEHEAPPFLGGGLLQCLVLFFFPVWSLQELQDPQELHAPFTKKIEMLSASVENIAGDGTSWMF